MIATLFLSTISLFAQRNPAVQAALREYQQLQGPGAVLNETVDAWVRGDQLYYRSAKLPLTTPQQIVQLAGRATQIAAADGKLYVWVGDSELYQFTIDATGASIDPTPLALAVDDAVAARALANHYKQVAARTAVPQAKVSDPEVVVNPPKLFVTNTNGGIAGTISGDSMLVIDTSKNTTSGFIGLNTGDAPNDVVVTADNSKGYIANYGCGNCVGRGITVFDASNGNAQTARLQPTTFPYALAVSSDGTRLYVSDQGMVRIFDQTGTQLFTVNTTYFAQRMVISSDNKYLFIMASTNSVDQVQVLNTTSNAISNTLSLPGGSMCAGLAVSPNNTQVFVGCFGVPKVYSLAFSNGVLTMGSSISSNPTLSMYVSPDGKKLYVPYTNTGTVDVLDTTTLARITQIQGGSGSVNIIVNKAGTRAYVANVGSSTLSVLDLTTNTNIASIPTGPIPYGLALTTPPASVAVTPAQLVFTGNAGQASPAAQNIALSVDQTGSFTWTATATTVTGGNWLTLSAPSGTFPATLKVTANVGTLAVGTYSGTVSIATPNTGNTPQTIAVTLTVNPSGTLALDKTQLTYTSTVGAPIAPVTLNVTNTGAGGVIAWNAVVTGTVAPWLSLTPSSGNTPGTLIVGVNPQGLPAGTLSTVVTISSAGALNTVTLPISLTLAAGPLIPAGGIVNAASFAANTPVSAGALVSIFGSNFGPTTAVGSSTIPLPTTLSGVQVIMGGIAAPLVFVSSGQINCQVPFELAGQTTAQVIVMNGTAPSAAVTMQLAPASPGIFTAVLNGVSVGAILKADYSQITPDNPVKIGDVIQIFATGQGAVTNAPASGAGAPSSAPLALTPVNPVVLVGNQTALVAFSGLSPGFVGLWQVNVNIPAGVTPGTSVPVQIIQNGAISNSANISVVSQ